MSDRDFGEWVGAHITTTGAEPVRLTELLWANKGTILGRWDATYEELCECTQRLIEGRKVPEFPNGHTNAIGVELFALRAERARRRQTEYNVTPLDEPIKGCDCPRCYRPDGSPKYRATLARLKAYIAEHGSLTSGIFREVPK